MVYGIIVTVLLMLETVVWIVTMRKMFQYSTALFLTCRAMELAQKDHGVIPCGRVFDGEFYIKQASADVRKGAAKKRGN